MKNISPREVLTKALDKLEDAKRYAPVLFCVFFALLYIFVIYRVHVLNASEPSPADVAIKSNTASVPKVDPVVLKQLQELQDNSVSVQTLFNASRDNPFQE